MADLAGIAGAADTHEAVVGVDLHIGSLGFRAEGGEIAANGARDRHGDGARSAQEGGENSKTDHGGKKKQKKKKSGQGDKEKKERGQTSTNF
jgi:hypothetical protein